MTVRHVDEPLKPAPRDTLRVVGIGDTGYPGDAVPSDNWPGVAPGRTGILNALSPGDFDVSGIVDIDPKPPILWLRGDGDQVVGDEASLDAGTLGKLEILPGWPGADAPMRHLASAN